MRGKVKGPHEDLTYRIIGAAMAVHRRIGPGQKEAIYQRALEAQLEQEGLNFEPEKKLPVYDGNRLLGFYIPDFIVEGKVIVEIKAFSTLSHKYLGQVITYLNHTGLSVGLLINFGERSLRHRRVFPSPQATEFRHNYQWMFVPDWLKAQNQRDSAEGEG
jgi:GxxExxY protein